MRVGFIYTSPFPAKRGFSAADRRVRDLVRGLHKAGVETFLLVPRYHAKASLDSNIEEYPIEYVGSYVFGKLTLINRLFFWFAVLRYVVRNNIDTLILYNTQADSVLFSYFLKARGIKIVTEICDLHSNSDKFNLKALLAGWTERKRAEISDLVITISELLKNVILSHNPNANVVTIPILVDTEFFEGKDVVGDSINLKELKGDAFLISYVGGLWHHQGVRYLLHAFKQIIDSDIKAKLLIAGQYNVSPNCDDVLRIAAELEIEEHVIFPGWVDTNTVKSILDISDLLVISQTNHKFAQAGLPTKLAEYAACRKPILITNVGDVTKYFKDGESCLICEPADVDSMRRKIEYLINNPKIADLIASEAKHIALSKFDYKVNGALLRDQLIKMNDRL